MQIGFVRSAVVLGLLAVVGPFAIDLYLPAMPEIVRDLETDDAAVHMTFTVYFIAFGVAQLVYGPLADRFGRKAPVYLGLLVFIAGSALCATAADVSALTLGRFIQALGAAAPMVIVRAVVRDLHTGTQATRLMALVMLVISISPMLAPLTGSIIIQFGSWRMIFAALGVIALAAMVLMALQLPETLPADRRSRIDPAAMIRSALYLLRDGKFMGLTLIAGFSLASFFVFLAAAPLVYMTEYQLTPTTFSLVFALNAVGFFASSQFAASLGQRYGMARVALLAVCGFAAATSLLFVLVWNGIDDLPVLMALLFIGNTCLGQVIAPTMVMAMEEHGEHAGMAASLGGTFQMVAGGVMILVCSPFFDRTPLPLTGAVATCALTALVIALLTLRPAREGNAPA
ncbi:multidrug effflux MFS transporter [Roseibium salinum]|uniref:Bcr/CflA family efflux transporter n=1 Tax=Roseibium salinum TaxID=1604349 RepID=A0ABT3R810_9HYPH|nr:multidrug effflux MFS transporter [Roseibium sp. DSM 29163]MCX2725138.1 multidrug effflux MFS transporter [Roseibium sp. DSM 29163]